jgi:hypothetical protein
LDLLANDGLGGCGEKPFWPNVGLFRANGAYTKEIVTGSLWVDIGFDWPQGVKPTAIIKSAVVSQPPTCHAEGVNHDSSEYIEH